jgi:hypothetical protein
MTADAKNYLKEAHARARVVETKCNSILKKLDYSTELYKQTAHKRTLVIECAEYIERALNNGKTNHEVLISKQTSLL